MKDNYNSWITGLAIALVVFLFILGVFLKFRNRPATSPDLPAQKTESTRIIIPNEVKPQK